MLRRLVKAPTFAKWRCCRRRPNVETHFFPDAAGRGLSQVLSLLENCQQELNLAMFALTDDRLANAVFRCKERGVKVRVIVDDVQAAAPGADAKRLAKAGLPVRHDASASHMHHKFATIDGKVVVTGSFNWTVRASVENREHLVMIHDAEVAETFNSEFEKLWLEFRDNEF
jgi:cardiolipin hydrolase